jgi:hypothetical protein
VSVHRLFVHLTWYCIYQGKVIWYCVWKHPCQTKGKVLRKTLQVLVHSGKGPYPQGGTYWNSITVAGLQGHTMTLLVNGQGQTVTETDSPLKQILHFDPEVSFPVKIQQLAVAFCCR